MILPEMNLAKEEKQIRSSVAPATYYTSYQSIAVFGLKANPANKQM